MMKLLARSKGAGRQKILLLAVLTGLFYAVALPPFKGGFFAYFALVPFFLILEKHPRSAFRYGYLVGLVTAIATLFWIGWVTLPGMFGVLLVWPLYIALYARMHVFFLRRFGHWGYVLAPFLWTSIEYLQSLTELAFPWNYIGYSQSYYVPLIQYSEVTSVYGVSFWIVWLNVHFFFVFRHYKRNRRIAIAHMGAVALLILIPFIQGSMVLTSASESAKKLKVSLIQGNRDPNAKWSGDVYEDNFSVYSELTREAAQKEPNLVIWPETALPFYLRSKPVYMQRMRHLADSIKATILTGMMDFVYFDDGSYENYNAAMLFEPGTFGIQSYNKMKLVPFSERVPYKKYFPFNVLKDVLWDLGIGDFGVGDSVTVFTSSYLQENKMDDLDDQALVPYKTGTAICYESVFPEHVRKYVNAGADFLIIITNDAWFGKTSAPFQHAQIAVFRAIENRRDIARCANTGISCFIDKYGRVRNASHLFTRDVITDNVGLNNEHTFYTKHGNVFVIFVAISTILFFIVAVLKEALYLNEA